MRFQHLTELRQQLRELREAYKATNYSCEILREHIRLTEETFEEVVNQGDGLEE